MVGYLLFCHSCCFILFFVQSSYDIRTLKKERDELKHAVAAFETELEQVGLCWVHVWVC